MEYSLQTLSLSAAKPHRTVVFYLLRFVDPVLDTINVSGALLSYKIFVRISFTVATSARWSQVVNYM